MSKMSKEVANVLKNTEIIEMLVNDEGKGWYDDIKIAYDDYSIENPVIYDTEIIVTNLLFTVGIVKKECDTNKMHTELYVGDLLNTDTEKAIDASFIMSDYMNNDFPSVSIYAYNEDDEEDNEIIILIEL